MQQEELTRLLQHPESLNNTHVEELKQLVDTFPYFQAARALYLKGLKNTDSFKYNNALKQTAAHTTDRSVLFDFITSKEFNQNAISENIKQNTEYLKKLELSEVDDISVNKSMLIDEALKTQIQSTERVLDPELFERKSETENIPDLDNRHKTDSPILAIDVDNISTEERLELGKPLEFSQNETHSFTEWLKITDFKPIERSKPVSPIPQTRPFKVQIRYH